ncbi:hypothetical protein BS47DRAFT_1368794 [Hydnum rufescens UP504]|uniref:Uncharacterized protein n=1 Tax=Hydnum rufescens UP504 TaxID=1448309 RepID=A0A9P6DMT4_9AGAM|nr:hypothetical protein BS47DRAFT_1368794 [Hydnum rufescens UP504]
MAPKRKLFEVTPSQDLHDYFLIMKIPNHPESDTFINNILLGVDDLKTMISRGLGQFIMWCSVVGLRVITLHCTSDYNTMSLAFRVPDKDSEHISKTLVGNHENHDKKGFQSFPDQLMPWVGFTMFDKCTYLSAGLVPQWWKGFRPSKKDWELIERIAVDWDANPCPKVMASTVVPTQFPRHFFHWPAISAPSETIPTTSTMSAMECSGNEHSPKCPRIDSLAGSSSKPIVSAGSSSEPILYNWFGDNSNGCKHYLDSRFWEPYYER